MDLPFRIRSNRKSANVTNGLKMKRQQISNLLPNRNMDHAKKIQAARLRVKADVGTNSIDKLNFDGVLDANGASAVRVALKAHRKFLDEHAFSLELKADEDGDQAIGILIVLGSDEHPGFKTNDGVLKGPSYSPDQAVGLANLLKGLNALKQSPHLGEEVEVVYFCERNVVFLNLGGLL